MANIFGTSGNDFLVGTSDNDLILGFDGNDILNGGLGADTLEGGNGNDSYFVDDLGDVVIEATNDGLGGVDTVTSSVTFTLGFGLENLTLIGSANINGTGNSNNNIITGNNGSNTLSGGDGNDTFIASIGNDTLNGGVGVDIANYTQLNTSITLRPTGVVSKGASGTDQLVGVETIIANASVANNTIDASTATGVSINANLQTQSLVVIGVPVGPFTVVNFDDVIGTSGNDSITGDSQNNVLSGGDGNDTLNGGLGADTLIGGNGNDTYTVDNVGDVVIEATNDALGGVDTVNSSVSFTLGFGLENLTLIGSANINGTGNSNNNIIIGNSGSNTLSGGDGNDTLIASIGNDTLNGGVGVDTANYSQLNTSITLRPTGVVSKGASGTDQLVGVETIIANASVANNTIDASTATGVSISANLQTQSLVVIGVSVGPFTVVNFDNVIGTSGNDSIIGDSQNNVLSGGDGNDTLDGGLGADTLIGGNGNDSYFVDNVGDVVSEATNDALGGVDTVTSSVTFTLGFGLERLRLIGSANINGTGNSNNNIITGNSGNNRLSGGDGNDTLNGGAGADTLLGGNGNDVLIGGAGNDLLTGGAGADKFVFNNLSEGIDFIQDFNITELDKIQISQSGFGASSSSSFSYNSLTGNLSFQGIVFANISNTSFVPSLGIEFIA